MTSSLAKALAAKGIVNASNSAPDKWLNTGNPVLNHRISGRYRDGGLPMGRIHEIFGPASAGKTIISTAALVAAQQADGLGIFNDHERSFDKRLGVYNGLNVDPDRWVYQKPRTFEESLDKTVEIIELVRSGNFGISADAPICTVFDSLASMVPQSKLDKTSSDYDMHDNLALPRATSAALPAFAQIVEENNVTVLFLNQTRQKIGVVKGDNTKTPGGGALEFYASVRLKLGGAKIYNEAKGIYTGKHITAETVKNKTHRPHLKTEWDFIFQPDGSGKLDVVGAVVDELKELGILETAGAYIVWEGKRLHRSVLIEKIEAEGKQQVLFDMLPA